MTNISEGAGSYYVRRTGKSATDHHLTPNPMLKSSKVWGLSLPKWSAVAMAKRDIVATDSS